MASKKIGIVGWNTGDNSFGATKPYLHFLSMFGEVQILSPSKGIVKDLDLLVLPGGKDVTPSLYGQVPSFYTSDPDVMKEHFMKVNLPQYIKHGTPIFGICLGMQQLCVHFGAKMIQNIPFHAHTDPKDRSELVHKLDFKGEWGKVFGPQFVNSLHHQAVSLKNFPEELEVVAQAAPPKKDPNFYPGLEIVKHRELPIWGVQYHPEEILDDASELIINQLLKYERAEPVRREIVQGL